MAALPATAVWRHPACGARPDAPCARALAGTDEAEDDTLGMDMEADEEGTARLTSQLSAAHVTLAAAAPLGAPAAAFTFALGVAQ